jgi:hypothetical protein
MAPKVISRHEISVSYVTRFTPSVKTHIIATHPVSKADFEGQKCRNKILCCEVDAEIQRKPVDPTILSRLKKLRETTNRPVAQPQSTGSTGGDGVAAILMETAPVKATQIQQAGESGDATIADVDNQTQLIQPPEKPSSSAGAQQPTDGTPKQKRNQKLPGLAICQVCLDSDLRTRARSGATSLVIEINLDVQNDKMEIDTIPQITPS